MSNPIINKFGNREWYNDKGEYHNENGPAIIWPDGTQFWFINGQAHRTDGPSYIGSDGYQSWCINGIRYHDNQSYQKEAGISDKDMNMIVLQYGSVT